jgi:hypothetical protein
MYTLKNKTTTINNFSCFGMRKQKAHQEFDGLYCIR